MGTLSFSINAFSCFTWGHNMNPLVFAALSIAASIGHEKQKANHFQIKMPTDSSSDYELTFRDQMLPVMTALQGYVQNGLRADSVQNNFQCIEDSCEKNEPQNMVSIYMTDSNAYMLQFAIDPPTDNAVSPVYANGTEAAALQMTWDDQGKNVKFYGNGSPIWAYCRSSRHALIDLGFSTNPSGSFKHYELCSERYGDWY